MDITKLNLKNAINDESRNIIKEDIALTFKNIFLNDVKDIKNSDVDNLIIKFNRAIESDPSVHSYYVLRAMLNRRIGKDELSLSDLKKAIELNPDSHTYFQRGNTYLLLEQDRLAIKDYDMAIKLDPDSDAYKKRTIAYVLLGNIQEALDSHEEMLINKTPNSFECDKEIMDAFIYASQLALELKEYKKAKNFIEYGFQCSSRGEKEHEKIYLKNIHNSELLEISNKKLEEEKKKNTNLVQRYSHTLANTIFPKTLYKIAERIKGNVELKKDALLLHDAYHAEISIILENELLQLRYASSNPETFRQSIRGDRLPVTNPHAHSIQDILNYALSRVLTRLLNQNHAKAESVRDRLINNTGRTLDDLRHNFEDALFLSDQPQTAIAWCNSNLRPIELHFSSPKWEDIGIRQEGLSEAMLYGHFAEILFNAFKYADHQSDWFLRINFGELEDEGVKYLTISWENPLLTESRAVAGSGQGLAAVSEDLQQLNDKISPEHTLHSEKSKGCFKLNLCYQADLLCISSLPKIDVGDFFIDKK